MSGRWLLQHTLGPGQRLFLPLASATFIERLLSYHEEDNIDMSAGRKGGRHGRRT